VAPVSVEPGLFSGEARTSGPAPTLPVDPRGRVWSPPPPAGVTPFRPGGGPLDPPIPAVVLHRRTGHSPGRKARDPLGRIDPLAVTRPGARHPQPCAVTPSSPAPSPGPGARRLPALRRHPAPVPVAPQPSAVAPQPSALRVLAGPPVAASRIASAPPVPPGHAAPAELTRRGYEGNFGAPVRGPKLPSTPHGRPPAKAPSASGVPPARPVAAAPHDCHPHDCRPARLGYRRLVWCLVDGYPAATGIWVGGSVLQVYGRASRASHASVWLATSG
jgi:hypothetical protein